MGGPSSAGAPLRDGRVSGLQPELLLRHARQLAERSTDTESPRSVHARRAVSAAYYALFHRVCMGVASTVVPGESDRARWELCRTFDHKAVETVARWADGRQRPPRPLTGLADQALTGPQITVLARNLVHLKQWRHDADYNFLVVVGRLSALQAVDKARDAIDAVNVVVDSPAWRAFSALLLFKSNAVDR
jgi:hypothetical protein